MPPLGHVATSGPQQRWSASRIDQRQRRHTRDRRDPYLHPLPLLPAQAVVGSLDLPQARTATRTNTDTHTHAKAHVPRHTCRRTLASTRAPERTHRRTHRHAHTRTHAHTHTHAHTKAKHVGAHRKCTPRHPAGRPTTTPPRAPAPHKSQGRGAIGVCAQVTCPSSCAERSVTAVTGPLHASRVCAVRRGNSPRLLARCAEVSRGATRRQRHRGGAHTCERSLLLWLLCV